MKILTTPWKTDFLDLVANCEQSIKITSPFVKENVCRELIAVKKQHSQIELVTSFKLSSIYAGSLDLSALELILSNNGIVKNFPKLHSKIYLFDQKQAIITSGNLTNGGLLRNYEYGILTDSPDIVEEIHNDFEQIWNSEIIGRVKQDDINSVKNILSNLPKNEPIKFPNFSVNADSPEQTFDILDVSSEAIRNTLNGWKLEVFKCLDKISQFNFTLNEIYVYEEELKEIYPDNQNIKDKIRQQLQYLRDLGLVEFLGAGNYRKLWK